MAKAPRVAIVHDWLVGGGAERVVQELHRMYPEAPIYTSFATDIWRARLDDKVITGYLQYWPFSRLRKYIPFLRQWWFTHLNLAKYDLVISSSGAEAKGLRVRPDAVHINYCHAPTHYYWSRYDEYMAHPGFGRFDGLARIGLRLLVGPLRKWDLKAAQRPTVMVANSTHIQSEIKKYYGRDSVVVHPPIDLERFKRKGEAKRFGFVTAGRLTPYKRIDLAVQACSELKVPLIVVGRGPDYKRLKKLGGRNVTFLTSVSDEAIAAHFQTANAFIMSNLDDFGVVAVEALAAGTPVIAYHAGGALDYVVPGKTGEFFDKQTVKSLQKALESFKPDKYKPAVAEAKAAEFSPAVFQKSMKAVIAQALSRQSAKE